MPITKTRIGSSMSRSTSCDAPAPPRRNNPRNALTRTFGRLKKANNEAVVMRATPPHNAQVVIDLKPKVVTPSTSLPWISPRWIIQGARTM